MPDINKIFLQSIPSTNTYAKENAFDLPMPSLIIADEQTAATFCVYCGNTAILKSKLSGEFTPDKMLVFKKEKQESKEQMDKMIKEIVIPTTIDKIDVEVFYGCKSLKTINIPSSVTSIGKYAFKDCISLKNINIPTSIQSINHYAFCNCYNLPSFSAPISSINNKGASFILSNKSL